MRSLLTELRWGIHWVSSTQEMSSFRAFGGVVGKPCSDGKAMINDDSTEKQRPVVESWDLTPQRQ